MSSLAKRPQAVASRLQRSPISPLSAADLIESFALHTGPGALLDETFRHVAWSHWEEAMYTPARDFLNRSGKQFRGNLVRLSWQIAGGIGEPPVVLPHIVELMHAGSLIIDDIEDQAETRRGLPALHQSYGLPRALNVGNWLYFWPFVLLDRVPGPESTRLEMYQLVGQTLWRCHYGQGLDISVQTYACKQDELPQLVTCCTRYKTGALFECAMAMGALAAGAPAYTVHALARFGKDLGIGLQMLDDLGGLMSDERADKSREDLLHARITWPWAWIARRHDASTFRTLQQHAREVAEEGGPWKSLRSALNVHLDSQDIVTPHDFLQSALDSLPQPFRDHPASQELEAQIRKVEQSYV